jgi:peptide/nickel transport system permease protein
VRVRTVALLLAVAGLHSALLLAGFLSPYDPALQNRDLPYAPPTRLHFTDASGFHLRPFVYAWTASVDGYQEDHERRYPVFLLVTGASYRFAGIYRTERHLFGVQEPGKILLLGTDGFGRDEFSRILYGGQISVAAGLVATFITVLSASIIGLIAGFYGRWIDELLMGLAELFLALPWLYFLLGVRAFLPLHLSPIRTFFLLVGVIGLVGWAAPARLVRGVVLSARHRNYVLAAGGFGGSPLYVVRRHILPASFGVLLTQAALLVPRYIAAEATLSFFGLGVNEPVPSWGNMLSTLQQYSVLVSYAWLLAPACALVVTSVIYSTLAEAIRHWLESYTS